jgi:hypothetical protein
MSKITSFRYEKHKICHTAPLTRAAFKKFMYLCSANYTKNLCANHAA